MDFAGRIQSLLGEVFWETLGFTFNPSRFPCCELQVQFMLHGALDSGVEDVVLFGGRVRVLRFKGL